MVSTYVQRLAEAVLYYAQHPGHFVRDVLKAEPDPWQEEALNALAAGRNVAVRSGHGTGKSADAAWAIIWRLLCFPHSVVPVTAPTQHQLQDVLWPELAKWIERAGLDNVLRWTATRVSVVGHERTWFAVARTSNQPERLAGFHNPYLLYVVDEASGIPQSTWEVIDGARTTAGAVVLAIGNPTQRSGGFFDAFHRHRKFWHCIHVSSADSPRVDPAWVEEMAQKWGRDSDIFRVRVLGEFPRGDADTFITVDLAEAAAMREVPAEGPVQIGVDVARYGDSETVIVARQGLRVLWMECYRQRGVTEVTGLVLAAARRAREQTGAAQVTVAVDDTGVGGGVTDGLRELAREHRWLKVVPVNFGGAGDEHYADTASAMWGRLRELLAEIAIPNDDDLIGQLTTRRYRVTPKGKVQLESKEDLRRRGLPSPDRADALALAFWEPGGRSSPEAERLLRRAKFYA